MPILSQEDLECFKCSLEDCKERNKNCKRRKLIEDNKQYKQEIHTKRMTSQLKIQEPIVVR